MKDWAEMTAEFAEKNGHPAPNEATLIDDKKKVLRLRLMMEELGELACAMHEQDLVEIADGLCDLLYVTVGTAVAYGLGPLLDGMFREVHRSNMTKFSSGESHSDTGAKYQSKVGKSDTYEPPRIAELLAARLTVRQHCDSRYGPLSRAFCTLPAGHEEPHRNEAMGLVWQK